MKILVAENDDLYAGLYGRMLRKWGHSYDLAADGEEAVGLAVENEGEYDICLMDVDMPRMSGYEAAELIRHKTRYFPILGVTGNVSVRDRYSECGMDDYLKKPFGIDEVRKKIDELTVKLEAVRFKDDTIIITKEMPMDKKHAEELRELAKKDLRKVKFFESPESTVIVHKNVTNRISHDFNVKKQSMSVFINRDPERPTRCELYKHSNYLMPQMFITEEEYEEMIDSEDRELQQYVKPALKGEDE